MKSREEMLVGNMKELERFKNMFLEENVSLNQEKQLMGQNFYNEFRQNFPGETIESLKIYMVSLSDKCLSRFNDIECRNFNRWNEQKNEMNVEIVRLNGVIEKLKVNQNELLNSLK